MIYDKMHNHCAIFAPNGTYQPIRSVRSKNSTVVVHFITFRWPSPFHNLKTPAFSSCHLHTSVVARAGEVFGCNSMGPTLPEGGSAYDWIGAINPTSGRGRHMPQILIRDLERKANSLSRETRQASALGLEGGHPTLKTAPLGMTKTPTLRRMRG